MYKLWIYPASHEERPNKGTGTHEEHAFQHRPTTHPPLGVPLQILRVSPLATPQMATSAYHVFFGSWVRIPPSTLWMNIFRFSPCRTWKHSPRYTREMKPLGYWQVHPYTRPTWYPAVSGGESVVRLSPGELVVNLLQVVKRTNTPLSPQHLSSTSEWPERGTLPSSETCRGWPVSVTAPESYYINLKWSEKNVTFFLHDFHCIP